MLRCWSARIWREPRAGAAREAPAPARGYRVALHRAPADQQGEVHRPLRRAHPRYRHAAPAARGTPSGRAPRPPHTLPAADTRRTGGDEVRLRAAGVYRLPKYRGMEATALRRDSRAHVYGVEHRRRGPHTPRLPHGARPLRAHQG